MSVKEFSVDVSNGYLLIAVKIPTDTCTACGAVYTPTVVPEAAKYYLDTCKMPIDSVFTSPWCGEPAWTFIHVDGRRALVCHTCATPFTEAERAGQAKADAAAREICKKIDARGAGT